ncbi:MAG: hypothetical protein IJS02_01655, partial [Bacteroidales bacterium]|nr:hypothetical protein [Bacteroidales bacterium]
VRLSYDGLYFENERWTSWGNNGNAAQAWIVNPENLTDIEVGQTEGTSHSYHTYEWLRVVHNNVDR